MAWYGPLFVTLGQYVWLKALRLCDPSLITIFTNFMFVLNMIWAVILLGRYPTNAEYLGGAVILLSVLSGLYEKHVYRREQEGKRDKEAKEKDVEEGWVMVTGEDAQGTGSERQINIFQNAYLQEKHV